MKTPWRDGTTHVVFSVSEFLEKLAVLVPAPRAHLVKFHGILAQQHFIKWMLADLLREVTGRDDVDLSALRSEFRSAIQPVAEELRRKRAAKHSIPR